MTNILQESIEKEMIALEGSQLTSSRERMNELIGQVGRMEVVDENTCSKGGDLVKILTTDLKKLDESRKETTKKPREYVSWVNEEFKKITDPLEKAVKAAKAKMKTWADEEERKRREIAEAARKKAEAEALEAAEKAEKEAKAAREKEAEAIEEAAAAKKAGDDAAAEEAAKKAEQAKQEATEHENKAEQVIDAAANAPVADTTVRKVRGNYGSTTGIRKVWKCEVIDLHLFMKDAESFLSSIVENDPKVKDAVRIAVQKAAIARFQSNNEKPIAGLKISQESDVTVR